MTEKMPDPLPAHLACLSDKDLDGVIKRAEREGISLDKIKLRASDLTPDAEVDPEEQAVKDALGIAQRSKSEGKTLDELDLRETDDPRTVQATMVDVIKSLGFAVKSSANRPKTGKLSGADVDRMIAEEKAKENKGK